MNGVCESVSSGGVMCDIGVSCEGCEGVSGRTYRRAMAYSPLLASLSRIRNTPSFILWRHCSASIRDILPMNLNRETHKI